MLSATNLCLSTKKNNINQMSTGKRLVVLLAILWALQACKKETIGFLQTEYASYAPDTLVVKAVLDTSFKKQRNEIYDLFLMIGFTPEQLADPNTNLFGYKAPLPDSIEVPNNDQEFKRNKYKVPWITIPIQGLRGTFPLLITVDKVTSTSPDAEKMKKMLHMRGSSGIMEIPFDHGLAPGRYMISLKFSNEGWTKYMKDAFTFIVE
jgi:hypothetical protein